jgi:hypothetical protein
MGSADLEGTLVRLRAAASIDDALASIAITILLTLRKSRTSSSNVTENLLERREISARSHEST